MGYILLSDIYSVARTISASGLCGPIATYGCQSSSQWSGGTFFVLVVVENPSIAVEISTQSIVVPEI